MSLLRMILYFFACLGIILILQSSLLIWRIHKGVKIAQHSRAFEHRDPQAHVKILVIGDSTGVGTGAILPKDSIAGRLHQHFPYAALFNSAVNGAHVIDLVSQLAQTEDHFDLIIVQAGGNDILRFTDLKVLEKSIETVLAAAALKADKIIFLSTGNVGLAPAFFAPLSWMYTGRTRTVREIFVNAAADKSIEYVDLFKEKESDPFLKDPERYYAADFLHPGSEGYRLWYEELLDQTSIVDFLRQRLSHEAH